MSQFGQLLSLYGVNITLLTMTMFTLETQSTSEADSCTLMKTSLIQLVFDIDQALSWFAA
jgi:hypothetical protein